MEFVHKSSNKTRIIKSLPALITASVMMWTGWVVIYSAISFVVENILKLNEVSVWMTQTTMKPLLTDHPAVLFNLGITLPRSKPGFIFIITGWLCLVVLITMIESALYSFSLTKANKKEITLFEETKKWWKKIFLFSILFTPVWIVVGLLGFFISSILFKFNMHPAMVQVIKYLVISIPLIMLIPARFYYLEGNNFISSILKSLENFKKYFSTTLLIMLPAGIIYIFAIQYFYTNANTLHLLTSYAPFMFVVGIFAWFFWSLSVFLTAKRYTEINKDNQINQRRSI